MYAYVRVSQTCCVLVACASGGLLTSLWSATQAEEKEGIWFDISQVNLDDPKKHSDSNFEVLQTWIDQIMSGSITLDDDDDDEPEPTPPPPPAKGKKGKKEL
ncbi:hypothetical protein ANCDUO_17012 [Ancylostoma duodenale]|uniref:Uncharacterized protein n=1 Tax=Ancylostoma duodenale TaxID=51022 RepID=A0A0C2CSV9_9BILA|nr:hypothetical protein ANCDUO_17012 [Ancylostoma duodenale]